MIDITQSIKACAAFYGKDADAMELYLKEGEKKALGLDNRGPIKFDDKGNLCKEIRKSYSEYGFYIFENVIDPQELNDIKEDLENLRTNFPTGPDSNLDLMVIQLLMLTQNLLHCFGPNLWVIHWEGLN